MEKYLENAKNPIPEPLEVGEFDGNEITLRFENNHGIGKIGYYLNDNLVYTEKSFNLQAFAWLGCRIGVFTWNDIKESGFADFKDFNVFT